MMEDQRGLFIAFRLPKIVAHYEDDVNVIWVGLSGDITAKDNEAFEFASAASEVIMRSSRMATSRRCGVP